MSDPRAALFDAPDREPAKGEAITAALRKNPQTKPQKGAGRWTR